MQPRKDTEITGVKQPKDHDPHHPRREVTRFDVTNCDIRTQLMFESWATIPTLRILTLLLARKGRHIFSAQRIGEMLDLPKSTVIHALKLLRDNEYIVLEGRNYYLNLGLKSDQPVSQLTNELVESTNPLVATDQPISQDRPTDWSEPTNPLVANNNKTITIKNNDKGIEGLTRAGVYVHLTEISQELLRKRFADEGMGEKEIARAIEYLDKDFHVNAERRTPRDNFLEIVGWPLDKVRLEKAKLDRQQSKPSTQPQATGRPPPKEYIPPWEQAGHVPANLPAGSLTKALSQKLDMKRTGTK